MCARTNPLSTKVAALLALLAASHLNATTIYVDDDATGANDGSGWSDAFTDLQSALDEAVVADQIWVAAGTYTPSVETTPGDDRTATFQLISGVAVYGGFAGTENPQTFILQDRDLNANVTTLSGDLAGDDGPAFAHNTENAYHVVTASGTDTSAILDGFVITGGNADGVPSHFGGAGMYNEDGSPTVRHCKFDTNAALLAGGGVLNTGTALPTFSNCAFSNNEAAMGGAVYNGNDVSTFKDCSFNTNASSGHAGAMYNGGSDPDLIRCSFTDNTAGSQGGAIYNDSSNPTLLDCVLRTNSSLGDGGAINNWDGSNPTLTDCLLAGNKTDDAGGAIHSSIGSDTTLINCTVVDNEAAGVGGGLSNDDDSSPFLYNTILWDNQAAGLTNEAAQIHLDVGTPVIDHCCVQGWTGLLGGVGNIGLDPLFVNAPAGNYQLLSGLSPSIDAGNNAVSGLPSTDLAGNNRLVDDGAVPDTGTGTPPIIDMGAYEAQGDCNMNGVPDETETDTDGDGVIDACDLCPLNPALTVPGLCGCGAALTVFLSIVGLGIMRPSARRCIS